MMAAKDMNNLQNKLNLGKKNCEVKIIEFLAMEESPVYKTTGVSKN